MASGLRNQENSRILAVTIRGVSRHRPRIPRQECAAASNSIARILRQAARSAQISSRCGWPARTARLSRAPYCAPQCGASSPACVTCGHAHGTGARLATPATPSRADSPRQLAAAPGESSYSLELYQSGRPSEYPGRPRPACLPQWGFPVSAGIRNRIHTGWRTGILVTRPAFHTASHRHG
jgi:hypothetical protein